LDGRPVKHHAAIPVPDIPAFTSELATRNSTCAKALMFTLLTAVRTGDTIGASWAEIDLAAKTWTMAARRTKAGRPFRILLSKHAVKLLTGLPRNGDYVFSGARPSRCWWKGASRMCAFRPI
jgi:integrase